MRVRFGMMAFVLAVSVSAQEKAPAKKTAATKKADATKSAPAAAAAPFNRALLTPSKLTEKAPETYRVKFSTTRGDFVIQVTRAWAPLGADRFYNLVKNGFYDDATVFRVVDEFVAQFGIHAKPEVSRMWQNANIKDDQVRQSNLRGYITFAMGGKDTRTTQVFINLKDNSRLDAMGFPPFGKVIEGGMQVAGLFYSGYGESPDQGMIQSKGNAYLGPKFPKLDKIKSATIVP